MKKIFTKRLVLRKLEEDDLELFSEWSNSPDAFGKYLSMERHSLDECIQKYHRNFFWNDNGKTYLIELKEDRALGTIHYWTKIDKRATAVVALKIACSAQRGKGYGTEAQKILIMTLIDHFKFDQILMYTDIDNLPQQKCLQKLGFDYVESMEYEDHGLNRLGNLYRLTKEKFKSSLIYKYNHE